MSTDIGETPREQAQYILAHYFNQAIDFADDEDEQNGQAEIRLVVDLIIDAATEAVLNELPTQAPKQRYTLDIPGANPIQARLTQPAAEAWQRELKNLYNIESQVVPTQLVEIT